MRIKKIKKRYAENAFNQTLLMMMMTIVMMMIITINVYY